MVMHGTPESKCLNFLYGKFDDEIGRGPLTGENLSPPKTNS